MQLRLYQKLRSSKGLVSKSYFYIMVDPCYRKNTPKGSLVKIADESNSLETLYHTGIVKKILTTQKYSEDGTRVELESGKKGPVQSVLRVAKFDEDTELLSGDERGDVEFKGSYTSRLGDERQTERFYNLECVVVSVFCCFIMNRSVLFLKVNQVLRRSQAPNSSTVLPIY